MVFENSSKAKRNILIVSACVTATLILICTVFYFRKSVTVVVDGDAKKYVSYKGNVCELLKDNNIEVNEDDKVEPSVESKLIKNQIINIKKAVPIKVCTSDTEYEIMTTEDTVKEALSNNENVLIDNGISYDKNIDEVFPSKDSKIKDINNIRIVKVEKKECVETEPINYETVVENSSDYDISYEKVKNEGADGEKEITYNVVYKDGQEVSKQPASSKVTLEPVNKVVLKGSNDLSASRGKSTQKTMTCAATAYSGGWGTSSGRKPVRIEGGLSTIAVDPSVIPMGSKVYIDGYGYAVAADTGTAIKGNKIDLYFNSYQESCDWGLRNVNLTIIAYPGEW